MDTSRQAEFEQAVGKCFADGVCPPVPFDLASAHECFEAVSSALSVSSPAAFLSLTSERVDQLAASFSEWFDCAPPSEAQLRSAVKALLRRWPAE